MFLYLDICEGLWGVWFLSADNIQTSAQIEAAWQRSLVYPIYIQHTVACDRTMREGRNHKTQILSEKG